MEKYKLNNEKYNGSKCWAYKFTWCYDKYNYLKNK